MLYGREADIAGRSEMRFDLVTEMVGLLRKTDPVRDWLGDNHHPKPQPALPPPLRKPIGIIAVIAAVITAVLAIRYSGNIAADPLDRWVQATVRSLVPQHRPGAELINLIGEPVVMAVLVGLLAVTCVVLRRRRLAVVAVTGPSMTGVVTTVLKPVIGRTIHGANLSYPSGHTAAATGLALIIMLLAVDLLRVGRLLGVLLILSGAAAAGVTMAWSQITLSAHYPTDTIGGFCTAMAVFPAALLVDAFVGGRRDKADTSRAGDYQHR